MPKHVKLRSDSDLSLAQLFVTVMGNLLGNSVVCAYLSFYRSTGLQAIQLNLVLRQCCYSESYSKLIETKLGEGIFGRKSTYTVKHTSTGYKFSDAVKGFHTHLKNCFCPGVNEYGNNNYSFSVRFANVRCRKSNILN